MVDWKDSWALPPQKSLSSEGYFQQRFYAALVMLRYPSIEKVTLREHYVRYSESRESTVFRSQLADILEEISALCERWDRTWEHGKWPLKDGEELKLFTPSPGAHCTYCPAPGKCPIFPAARVSGAITDAETAEVWAAEQIVAKSAVKQRDAALKAWGGHSSIPIKHAKDPNRRLGYVETVRKSRPTQEELETALAEQGADLNPKDLYTEKVSSTFKEHSATDIIKDEAVDADLMNALEQSIKNQGETPNE